MGRAASSVAVAGLLLLLSAGIAQSQGTVTRLDRRPLDPKDVFGREMRLAEAAEYRASRIEHWRKALAAKPDHPMCIVIKSRIATELAQLLDKAKGEYPKPAEALKLYIEIVAEYNHMDYYRSRPTEETWGAQSLVPSAAVHAGSMLFHEKGDMEKGREYLLKAMADIEHTWRRRIADWASAPKPEPTAEDIGPDAGKRGLGKYRMRVAQWQRRRDAAAKGEVLGNLEMAVAKSAVRQFGLTGGRQRPYEVARTMQVILDRFPDTPIAAIAQGHTDQT